MDDRLERIEKKLDHLSEAVVSLARMEERMITLFNRMDRYELAQDKIDEKLADVEKTSVSRGAIFRVVDKATWIIVGITVALIIEIFAR